MQEQEIVTVIDNLYATFLRGDLNATLDLVSDDTEWTVYGPPEVPITGQFTGQSGARQFLEALIATQENIKLEITDRIAQGNKVVAIGSYSAKIKATGKTVSTPIAFDTAAAKTAYCD
jgi:ketosteroid isomerase-like protein